MKKKRLAALFWACMSLSVSAQTYVFQMKPVGAKKWGYADVNGNTVIEPTYDKTFPFAENGLAAVYNSKEKQYAFINLKNERLTPEKPKFNLNEVMGFREVTYHNNLVLVKIDGKWGFMDQNGKLTIPAIYTGARDFSEGYAQVKKEEKWFIIDTQGKETTPSEEVLDLREFSEGLAPYRATDKKYGFMNPEGKVVVKAEYESVGYFSNGLAWAKTTDRKIGFINKKGEWVIEPIYDACKEFDEVHGLALVRQEETWMYVDKKGKTFKFEGIGKLRSFSDGLAEGEKDGLRGFYNEKGEWAIKPKFQDVRDFQNGYACAKENNLWGIINKKGEWVVKPQFEAIKDVVKVK